MALLYADEGFPTVVTGLLRQFGHLLREVDEVKRDRPETLLFSPKNFNSTASIAPVLTKESKAEKWDKIELSGRC